MDYTGNHHRNVFLPALDLVSQHPLEENLNKETPETLPPTYFKMNAVIPLERENLMYLPLKFDNEVKRKALIDTGACANAMSTNFYEKVREASPNSLSDLKQAAFLNLKVASGRNVKVLGQIEGQFKFNEHNFRDTFLILPSLNSVVLGNPFFRKYSIEINPR